MRITYTQRSVILEQFGDYNEKNSSILSERGSVTVDNEGKYRFIGEFVAYVCDKGKYRFKCNLTSKNGVEKYVVDCEKLCAGNIGKWCASVNYKDDNNVVVSGDTVVFMLDERPEYGEKSMKALARIAVLEYEHNQNANLTAGKCHVDLRTVKRAGDNMTVNYQLKSVYNEISICIKD